MGAVKAKSRSQANSENQWNLTLNERATEWLLERSEYNAMVTFTFDSEFGVSYETAKLVFGIFVRKLRDELLGRKSRRRIPMAPVVEDYGAAMGGREGTHIHCLMTLPGNPMSYMDVIQRVWRGAHATCGDPKVYCPDSDQWYLEISSAELRATLVGYVLKRCQLDLDGLLVQYM